MIIVYTYICGDILHKGHIEYMQNAKALGDKLIVGVLTDEAVMEKKSAPVIKFDERFDMIRALKFVDVVVAQETYCPLGTVLDLRPDILVESESHNYVTDPNLLKIFLGQLGNIRMVIFPYYPNRSSSEIKERIKEK